MAKLTWVLILFGWWHWAVAQKPALVCATDKVRQNLLHTQKGYAQKEQNHEAALLRHAAKAHLPHFANSYRSSGGNCNAQQPVFTIPAVVHIVHRSGIPIGSAENLTNEQVTAVLNAANDLFAHSSQAVFSNPFSGVNTGIELCLAARTPEGNPTNGILRHESNALSANNYNTYNTQNALNWNTNQYLNIYLVYSISGSGGSVSGYSTMASSHGTPIDGVVIQYEAWWEKLLAHETGHYCNLFHTFEGGCTNNNCLTNGDRVCDTPPKASPGGATPPVCSPSNSCPNTDDDDTSANNPFRPVALGGLGNQPDANENYMDYSGNCWGAFTQGQSQRMTTSLTAFRNSLFNTLACVPIQPNNAGIAAILLPNVFTCAATFAPIVQLTNYGTATLTATQIAVELNNELVYTYNYTGSLASNTNATVVLPDVLVLEGYNTLTIYTQNPNGLPDAYPQNDGACTTFTYQPPINQLPYCADAETGNLPDGWTLVNPDNLVTFDVAPAANCPQNGNFAIRYNTFGINTGSGGATDVLLLPAFDLSGYTDAQFSFNRAYKETFANLITSLDISVSADCGFTFTSLYNASGAALASVPGVETTAWLPANCSDWATQTLSLNSFLGQQVTFKITVTLSGVYGQNLFLDNICITGTPACPPPAPTVSPTQAYICTGGSAVFTASAIPFGFTQYSYQWLLNNNPISGATAQTYAATTPGNYSVQLYSATCPIVTSPTVVLSQYPTGNVPYANNFTGGITSGSVTIINPNVGSPAWVSGSTACYGTSAQFPNFGSNNIGHEDYLVLPIINLSSFANASLSFEVAYAAYSTTQTDALQVQVSTNCGLSYTTVYDKQGSALATAPPTTAVFTPASCAQWRTETINLSAFLGAQTLIRLVNINGNGNNLYLDNLNLNATLPCTTPSTPTINPVQAITCPNVPVVFTASAIAPGFTQYSYQWLLNGSIITGATAQTYAATTPGNYSVQLYSTSCPIITSLTATLNQYPTGNVPYANNFTGGITSGSVTIINPNVGSPAWVSGSTACYGTSAQFPNFGSNNIGHEDYLVLPIINLSSFANASLSFEVAYAAYSTTQTDALQVQVSTNCGLSYTTVYDKQGSALATAPPTTAVFTPASCAQWRTETINLSAFLGAQILIRLVNINGNGNNLYIDNLTLSGTTAYSGIKAHARLWLQGAYNAANVSMFTTLAQNNLLPTAQPYNRPPWNYAGAEQLTQPMPNVVDWVLLEILNVSYDIVARRAALLRNDGYLIDPDGTEGVAFAAGVTDGNAYRLRVLHRNHIGAVSAALPSLPNTGNAYLFTQPANVVGNAAQLALTPNLTFALKTADANPNGVVNFADAGILFLQWGLTGTYSDADLNLDGNINNPDFDLFLQNAGAIGVWQVRY
ncbi:MAG TPA: choice-of-anchor J domain-containing protein [Chitinophagales bacterium]|nr:choice-of-anchor J domain-containing protein [Chitinophagales bacterium]